MACCDLINITTQINWIDGDNNSDELNEHKSDKKVENEGWLIVDFKSFFKFTVVLSDNFGTRDNIKYYEIVSQKVNFKIGWISIKN